MTCVGFNSCFLIVGTTKNADLKVMLLLSGAEGHKALCRVLGPHDDYTGDRVATGDHLITVSPERRALTTST